jgi:hypothetical protein
VSDGNTLAIRILNRFIAASGFVGGYHWSSPKENGGRLAAADQRLLPATTATKEPCDEIPEPTADASVDPHSQAAIVARLVGAGIRADVVRQAIALLRTGQVDLVEAVITGRLSVERACRIARARP